MPNRRRHAQTSRAAHIANGINILDGRSLSAVNNNIAFSVEFELAADEARIRFNPDTDEEAAGYNLSRHPSPLVTQSYAEFLPPARRLFRTTALDTCGFDADDLDTRDNVDARMVEDSISPTLSRTKAI
jgi:hypothetical protein